MSTPDEAAIRQQFEGMTKEDLVQFLTHQTMALWTLRSELQALGHPHLFTQVLIDTLKDTPAPVSPLLMGGSYLNVQPQNSGWRWQWTIPGVQCWGMSLKAERVVPEAVDRLSQWIMDNVPDLVKD